MTLGPTFRTHWATEAELRRKRDAALYAHTVAVHVLVALILLAVVVAGFAFGFATRPLVCEIPGQEPAICE